MCTTRALTARLFQIASVLILLMAGDRIAYAQATTRSQDDVLGALEPEALKPGKILLDIGIGSIVTTRLDAGMSKVYPIVPYLSFRYGDWLAVDENEVRANLLKPDGGLGSEGWRAGPMLKVDTGRSRFSNADLRALPAVDPTLEAGGYVSYTFGPARVRLNVRGDATGAHGGAIVELNARSGFYQSGRLSLAAETEITWVSAPYMQAFHGVTAAEAAETGLRPFTPGSGFHDANFSVMGQFQFNKRWSIVGVTQYSRLLGGAADSPITIRRHGVDRGNFGAFIVYSF